MHFCKTEVSTLIALKEAFERDVSDDLYAVKEEIGNGPFNAGSGLRWDLTFRNVATIVKRLGLLTIPCRRGFWSFQLYLNLTTGELFVLMKEPNPDRVSRQYRHYLNCLLLLNPTDSSTLFSDDEYDAFRNNTIQELLGNYSSEVKQVMVISKSIVEEQMVSVTLKLYSREGSLLNEEAIPNRVASTTIGKIHSKKPFISGIHLKTNNEDKKELQ